MSVPPPSCTPNSTSTGSDSRGVMSATAVSNTIIDVRSVGSRASTQANREA